MNLKIISGGQTGADFGALLGAQDAGSRTGGTAPRGRITDADTSPLLVSFGLGESNSRNWAGWAKQNVTDSDVTVIIGTTKSPMSRSIHATCRSQRRPLLCIPCVPEEMNARVAQVVDFLLDQRKTALIVNVAGDYDLHRPFIREDFTRELIRRVCEMARGM